MSEFKNHPQKQIMSQILDDRYTDLEQVKHLCGKLLAWAAVEKDVYGEAFAHTYLADYYIARNLVDLVDKHLFIAKERMTHYTDSDELKLRIWILSGIYYEMKADEQNVVQSYLEAMVLARRVGDKASECIVLNNLGVTFQRHKSYEISQGYYHKAYDLLQEQPNLPIHSQVLSNLADISLVLGNLEDAKEYILECEEKEQNREARELFRRKNWCCYYAALGDRAQAEFWAGKVKELTREYKRNTFEAFENYNALCDSMLKIKNQAYAKTFFLLMEESCSGALDQLQPLEEKRLKYTIAFEPEENHGPAYKRFYRKNEAFRAQINTTIVEAMETKIELDKVISQKEKLQKEHENLESQVNMDELTGLYNRKFLDGCMRDWVKDVGQRPFGVIMLDVDYFKEYNDYYGHMHGDNVLKAIGSCLKANSREGIYPCRFGGDEFTCLCEGLTLEEIEVYILAICKDLAQRKIEHHESPCNAYVTLSIGYASESDHQKAEPYLLLQAADKGLYQSKSLGRNTYTRN